MMDEIIRGDKEEIERAVRRLTEEGKYDLLMILSRS
jgi:hypothetical protein